jgi:hypothetical protein
MALDEKYEYTKQNRLTNPCKYEFSKYEGEFFFKKYNCDREGAINIIKNNMQKQSISEHKCDEYIKAGLESSIAKCNCEIGGAEISPLNTNNDIDTLGALSAIASRYLTNTASLEDERMAMMFLKKFEVYKRLYEKYKNENGKYLKAASDYENISLYLLLANVLSLAILAKRFDEGTMPRSIIMLNALLKINDTLSSVLHMVCTPFELALALKALMSEKEILCILLEYY